MNPPHETRVKQAKTEADNAYRQYLTARARLRATAVAANKAGHPPTLVAKWANVTTQSIHNWRKQCAESQ